MKDFGWIKLNGKNIHVTSEDDVPDEEIAMTLVGMKLGDFLENTRLRGKN